MHGSVCRSRDRDVHLVGLWGGQREGKGPVLPLGTQSKTPQMTEKREAELQGQGCNKCWLSPLPLCPQQPKVTNSFHFQCLCLTLFDGGSCAATARPRAGWKRIFPRGVGTSTDPGDWGGWKCPLRAPSPTINQQQPLSPSATLTGLEHSRDGGSTTALAIPML